MTKQPTTTIKLNNENELEIYDCKITYEDHGIVALGASDTMFIPYSSIMYMKTKTIYTQEM